MRNWFGPAAAWFRRILKRTSQTLVSSTDMSAVFNPADKPIDTDPQCVMRVFRRRRTQAKTALGLVLAGLLFAILFWGSLLLAGLLLVVPPELCAQSRPPAVTPTTFRASSDFVLVDALALNKRTGTPIDGLTAQDFQISEDGVPQTIAYFSRDQLSLSVIFLFDLTDSVRDALKPLAASAREVLARLKPQDEVAVMTFSSHLDLLQRFTTDHALAAAAIEKASDMKSPEATFIFEDIWEAAGEMEKATIPGSRRVLAFFTDGTANEQSPFARSLYGRQAPAHLHSEHEATERLLRSGAVVAALIETTPLTYRLISQDVNPLGWAMGGGSRLGDVRHYADQTGGPVLDTKKTEAPDRMAKLLDELRDRYTLGYKPSASRRAGSFCRIRLTLTREARLRLPPKTKPTIRVRIGYYR
jgi:VWFA-related protein